MLNWFHHMQEKICMELNQEKYLPDRLKAEIIAAAKEYLKAPEAADEELHKLPY